MAFALALWATGCGDSDDGGGGERDAGDTTATEAEIPEEWDERVAPIAEWVAQERELEFEHPVEVRFLAEDDYTEAITEDGEGDDEEEQQDAEDTADLMRALGLVTGEVDLEAAGDDLAGEGTLAFYSAEDEVVYVRGEELTPAVRVTVAHELTHVLQDQHFDLDRLEPEDEDDETSEDAAGLRSVAEGDAGRIEAEYAEGELGAEERDEYEQQSEEDEAAGEEGVAEVPPALVALFGAPYALGEAYVLALEGETEAIDAALEDPPSEQELLDPAVRDTDRAEEVEVDPPTVPDGAEVVDEDTFGPVTWYLVLASRSDPVTALQVVDGWGGDAFASYRQDDQLCIDITVAGDDAEATAAFQQALDAWAAQQPGGGATVEAAGDAVTLHSCDSGEGAEPVGEVGPDAFSIPVGRTQLEAQFLQAYEATPEQARCVSSGLFEELSPEELTAASVPPEVQARVEAIAEGCRG